MAGCLRRARAPASRRAVSAAASISAGLAPASAIVRLSRIQMLTTGDAVPAVRMSAQLVQRLQASLRGDSMLREAAQVIND